MESFLQFGNIVFRFVSDMSWRVDQELNPFLLQKPVPYDVNIQISWNWDKVKLPESEMQGKDVLQEYYEESGRHYALSIGNGIEYLACAVWEADLKNINCCINTHLCNPFEISLGTIMRFLPIRTAFCKFDILFFHASQIAYREKGILFTAPSGTGKTTQARLWKKYKGAQIVCNDRTLIRRQCGKWTTYGYPLDGSDPVRSGEMYPLGGIILLNQGNCNRIERVNGAHAVSMLMQQLVLDGWDADTRTRTMNLLLTLLEEIPVYLYFCTKEPDAVNDLENRLTEDGVFENENNSR